ncbi:MAG: hypothetical protein K2X53_04910 [Alphaproteobacteria bacterium]|nr:hypothetical protein [Alphaproteobacteria bacterium]
MKRTLYTFLQGSWTFTRVFQSHRILKELPTLTYQGNAQFNPLNDITLSYEEIGSMTFNTEAILDAYQIRRYEFNAENEFEASVHYEDGRLIYRLDLERGYWCFDHYCGDDVYQGTYHLLDDRSFEVTWVVLGPRKKYTLKSIYKR